MNKKRMGLGCFRPRREAASPPPAPEASHSLSFTFPATFNSNDAASSSSLVSPDDDEIDYGEIDDDTQKRPPRPSFGGPPLPLPLPPPTQRSSSSSALPALYDHCYPKQPRKELRRFSLEELSGACLNFSAKFLCRDGDPGAVYKASLLLSDSTSAKVDIATIPPNFSPKTERKWMAKLSLLALTQHPNLCRVLGYHFADGGGDKPASSSMVVYAAMPNGSLDGLLYGRSPDVAPLDWQSRLKIALGAAQGVAFLHQLSPAETVYGCFHTANVQVDRDFTARLSDYCFASRHHGKGREAYVAPETSRTGVVSAKSNVWSFGVVLLELLSGRRNMEALFAENERDLVSLCRQVLGSESGSAEKTTKTHKTKKMKKKKKEMWRVIDPELKGLYASEEAREVARLALRCTCDEAAERPSMNEVVERLRCLCGSDESEKDGLLVSSLSVREGRSLPALLRSISHTHKDVVSAREV